tara:strand:- start:1138 stop:1926 length:789 start_codon:yes stop_codon:yes gene_type:complete
MDKSVFKVTAMDCAAEESLVRMGMDAVPSVQALEFDTSARQVAVYHLGDLKSVVSAMDRLGLGASHIQTTQSDAPASNASDQRRLLWTVLLINLAFFAIEMTTGLISRSMGLVADSLDMLADALVYGISLLAVGTTVSRKKGVAKWSGYLQALLALVGFAEVVRRYFGVESLPDYQVMIGVSVLALIANGVCLYLLTRSKEKEAHMQASMIFTSNDIIINLGVITAGVLVMWLDSSLPDLLIGTIVFIIVMRGAIRILALSK